MDEALWQSHEQRLSLELDGVAALSLGQGQAMMCWPFHPLLSCENLKITIWWKQCLKDLKINKLCNLFLLGYKAGLTAQEIRGLFSTFHPEAAHCCWMPGLHKAGIRDHSCFLSQPCLWSRALHAVIPMPWFPSLITQLVEARPCCILYLCSSLRAPHQGIFIYIVVLQLPEV